MRRKRLPTTDGRVSYARPAADDEAAAFGYFGDPANDEVYYPREKSRLPKAGAWVMVTRRLPPMENALDEQLRVARIFYAEHESDACDDDGFAQDGRYRVLVRSPWGDVRLWPYEYMKVAVEDILSMWQAGEVLFRPTNVEPARVNAIVFYARSRGIALADAMVMALGTLAGPVGWFEPTPDLAAAAEDMEHCAHAPLSDLLHQNRRAAARARGGSR